MTVAPVVTETVYALAGAALGPFNTVWPYAEDADVSAWLDYGNGPQLLANGSDYTLADLVPLETGGAVTLSGNLLVTGAWPAGSTLALVRGTAVGQPSSFGQSQALSPLGMMAAIDNLSRQIQELKTGEGRMVGAAYGEAGFNLPPAATRQGKVAFFAAGTGQLVGMSAALFTVTEQQTVFGTLVLAGAAAIAGAAEWILTLGCNASGDAGGGVYKRMGAEPVAPTRASFQSADGAWWQYTPDARGVSWRAFGADPTGVADSHAAIQDAVDFSVYFAKCASYGVGLFKTGDALQLGYGVGGFTSATLEGDGYAYTGAQQFRGTAILPTFSDRPCVNVQGGRGCVIRGIGFIGKNLNWIQTNNCGSVTVGAPLVDDTQMVNWIDPGLTGGAAQANGRFTPYAAITIDAYSGAAPGSAYPAVTYPAWAATVLNGGVAIAQYNKEASSDTTIEACQISGFVGGIAIHPSNFTGNGDFTKVRSCLFISNAWLLSAGDTQARELEWISNSATLFHTGFVSSLHGTQNGKLEGIVMNSSFDNCMLWFNCPVPSVAGPMVFIGCYGEANWSLGVWGNPGVGVGNALKMIGCEQSFGGQNLVRGIPAVMLTGITPAMISLDSCVWVSYWSVMAIQASPTQVMLDNVQLSTPQSARAATYQQLMHNAAGGGVFFSPSSVQPRPARFTTNMAKIYNLDTGVLSPGDIVTMACAGTRTRNHCPYAPYGSPLNNPKLYETLNPWSPQAAASFAGLALAASTETVGMMLTATQPAGIDPNFVGLMPGDVMVHSTTMAIFCVRSNVAGAITAELQNGFSNPTQTVGGGQSAWNTASFAAGTFYCLNTRVYTPTWPTVGTLANANDQITAAGRADGFNAYLGGAGDVQVGDAPFLDETVDFWTTPTTNLVTANAAGTITLTDNARYSMANKPLPWWIRAAPANV